MAAAQPQSREELLANFQGITAIDDVAIAIFHLDESNWDLLTAINRVMPQDIPLNHNVGSQSDVDVEVIDEDISVIKPKSYVMQQSSNRNRNAPGPSTSSSNRIRMLEFHIRYLDNLYELNLPDYTKYSDLKQRIAELSGVLPCRQNLDGLFKRHSVKPSPAHTLASLNLPDVINVIMTAPEENKFDDEIAYRLTQTYILNIECESDGRKPYKLNFNGDQTILKVKQDVCSLTNIPVRDQVWDGWPNIPNLDDTMLAMIDISFPEHNLKVKKSQSKSSHNKRVHNTSHSDEEDNSDEEFEDAEYDDDDMIMEDHKPSIREPLIPDNVNDEFFGSIRFCERFNERYGKTHPSFFQGSLDDAVKEACMKPAKDRRLLGIYLHHDTSISAQIYCTQLLGCESAIQILDANFVVFGWDLTFESNKNMLLSSVSNTLGPVACTTIKSIPSDKLPVLIIIMKIRSNTEIFSVINGNVTLEEFSGQLVEGVDRWTSRRDEEMQEEEERAARQLVKWEQDEAYRQSLEADRAKEEQKKHEEMLIENEKRRIEFERQEAEKQREELRQAALSRLPEEPRPDEPDITKIRIKLPDGKFLDRRFKTQTPLQALMDYLTVQGYPAEEYKIISSWPRRDLTSVSVDQTFFALKLFPQESVMLEKRSNE